jgi:ATP-binding cassette subfamily F protein uup
VNYLSLEHITKTYGEKILFDDLTLQVTKGQKIALIAKNGSGKSTLLRVAGGMEGVEGEKAKVWVHKGIRFAFLEQEPEFSNRHNLFEAILDSPDPQLQAIRKYRMALLQPQEDEALHHALQELDALKAWDMEAKVQEILFRLNVTDFDKPVNLLSGGQKKRVALARILLSEPEFIILDEPTNHLDLDMVEWLEDYLKKGNLTLLMVTHDRYFLERVCNQILELDGGKLYKYSGNYADYLEKKALRIETEGAEWEKNKKLLQKELAWVNRSPQARTTKAKSRVDAYFELKDKVGKTKVEAELQMDLKGQRLGKKVLELHHVSKAFDQKVILDGFSYKFKPMERVGIVGPNGVGKTTFINLITAAMRPDSGKVVVGENTVFGYYTQDGIQLLEDKRVLDVIQDIAEYIPLEKGLKLSASQLLERFLFSRKQQQVYVSQLSGGEKRRLYLLSVLMKNPNFLILDEPTNDLDILTLNVLEDFLMEFPGCVVIVSHDRYFMDKLVDHLFVLEGQGKCIDFNGDYSEYRLAAKSKMQASKKEEKAVAREMKESVPKASVVSFEQRKEINRVEKEILKLEEKKKQVTDAFDDPNLTPERIQTLSKELKDLSGLIEEKELRWLELND